MPKKPSFAEKTVVRWIRDCKFEVRWLSGSLGQDGDGDNAERGGNGEILEGEEDGGKSQTNAVSKAVVGNVNDAQKAGNDENPNRTVVKVDDIPIVAFIEDGLSAMTTKLGTMDFKEEIIVVIPDVKDYKEVLLVRVEYKWEPPRCGASKVFGHDDMTCPRRGVEIPNKQRMTTDGFQHPPKSASRDSNLDSKFS
nr:hypothetical protein [Tanacetum cinerariifolium]